ncbi:MAG: hypothetical protein E7158_00765 [Firmicutes bacterium]|nr:hypothetical protein [Bacillota bacterium]
MKMILSSCDFINENSKKVILDNIEKPLNECKLLFIPNEKATSEKIYSDKYYNRLYNYGFINKENIYIFDEENIEDFTDLNIDLLYISGGNTFATLKKIKDSGFDKHIINYIKNEVIYIGGSCGAHIVTNNIEHLLSLDDNYCKLIDYDALGLFDGIIIPHCEAEEYNSKKREELYNELVKQNKYKVYKLTNDESLVITNNSIKKC